MELFCRHLCEIVSDGSGMRLEYLKPCLIQTGQCTLANTADDYGIKAQTSESFERLTFAVSMPLVTV